MTGRSKDQTVSQVLDDDVERIQLSKEVERRGELNGEPFTSTTIRFLDGGVTMIVGTPNKMKVERLSSDEAVPARTKATTDFGRLSVAAQTMARHLARYGEKPPTPEQLATFLLNYQNLLAQREEAQKRLVQADGEIETVGRLLSRFVQ